MLFAAVRVLAGPPIGSAVILLALEYRFELCDLTIARGLAYELRAVEWVKCCSHTLPGLVLPAHYAHSISGARRCAGSGNKHNTQHVARMAADRGIGSKRNTGRSVSTTANGDN